MAFQQLVSDLTNYPHDTGVDFACTNSIARHDYEHWQKHYTWHALLNQRYGQSFCNHFGIQDHRIYFERNWQVCDKIIQRDWLARS
jgi:hypothetical protein